MSVRFARLAALVALCLLPFAQASAADSKAYVNYLAANADLGPTKVTLRDQAELRLPDDYAFVRAEPARAFLQRLGNQPDENLLGLILPIVASNWFVLVEYLPAGYIKDDDARNWDTDGMLKQIRDGTAQSNAERVKQHIPELEVLGWVEKPHYDATHHRLIWSISARDKGTTDSGRQIINYRTLMLGRQGYISMVMVTDLATIPQQKVIANTLLSGLDFTKGKRYADFNASTDKVAEYGLAALIGGFVIHKLGFFALMAAMAVKFAKVIGLAVLGGLAAVRRFFTGKKAQPSAAVATPAPMVAPPQELPPPPS